MELQETLATVFLGNTIKAYGFFLISLLLGLLFKRLVQNYLSTLLYSLVGKRTEGVDKSNFDTLLHTPLQNIILLGVIYIAFSHLSFPESWDWAPPSEFGIRQVLQRGFSLFFALTFFWILLRVVEYFGLILKARAAKTENKMDDQLIPFGIEIAKVILIILGGITILGSVFQVNITALATGLGIGGIAIAMASKESLENLLGSFTIFFDKPFTFGDIITVGGITGVVEKVGFRSTRIRTFDKSIVTVPNKNLVNAELDNLGVRPVRRVKFNIGLTYATSVEQIKGIVHDIQQLIDEHPQTNQDGRVRFQEFGASSLDILVMFYVDSPSWETLIDVKQEINYSIIEIVKKHKSDFAFPSTSVYLEKN